MLKNTTRRQFLRRSVGGAVGLAMFTSCAPLGQRVGEMARDRSRAASAAGTRINQPGYGTNASNKLSANEFGDRYFSSRKSVVKMNGIEYVFMPVSNAYEVIVGEEKDNKGNVTRAGIVLAGDNYLPFVAFDRSKMTVTVDPATKQVTYGYDDGTAIVFAKDNTIGKLNTGIRGKMRLSKKRVSHVSEPVFNIPTVHFGLKGYESVAHARIKGSKSDGSLVLIPNPAYAVNMSRGGILQIIPTNGAYVAEAGRIQLKPKTVVTPKKQVDPLEVTVERVPQMVPVQATPTGPVDPNSN